MSRGLTAGTLATVQPPHVVRVYPVSEAVEMAVTMGTGRAWAKNHRAMLPIWGNVALVSGSSLRMKTMQYADRFTGPRRVQLSLCRACRTAMIGRST